MKEMDHNAHSVYLLYYHLVMVVKYRRKVIDDPISERAKEIFEYIAPNYGITLEEWNHDIDHVHVMFRAQPKRKYQNLSMLIRVRAVGGSKKSIRKSGKNFGRKLSGVRVFAL